MDKREQKLLRKQFSIYSWALLGYYGLMNYLVSGISAIALIYEGIQGVIRSGSWMNFEQEAGQALEQVLFGNAWGYLLACGIATATIRLWKGKSFFQGLFESKRMMTWKEFGALTCVFLGGQLVFQVLAIVIELVLNLFGLSILESMAMASAGADTLSMFLYMGLAAPVVEELVFRGLILRSLEPWGKRFAIVTSALLFGLFHGNLIQSPFAFVVGLVLGYVTVEYSILWAMVLHMVNNLILGDTLLRLFSGFGTMTADLLIWGLISLCAAVAVVIIWRNRKMIAHRRENDPVRWMYLKAFLTAFPTLLLMAAMGYNAVLLLFW